MNEPVAEVLRVGTVLRPPKTAELIARHLRRRIVRGELRAGATLPSEVHLMEQFGVSRPTLREAFRILETESLIGVRRGARGGAQVLEPDPTVAARHVGLLLQMQGTTIQDVYEARMVTEPACAGLLAKVRTEQDLADLQDLAERLGVLIQAGFEKVPDLATWSHATYRFHELIMQRCGNKTLAIQGAVLAEIVDTHLQGALAKGVRGPENVPERFQKSIRSYKKLIQLVRAQNSASAEKHWRRHMEVAAQYIFLHDATNTPLVDIFG